MGAQEKGAQENNTANHRDDNTSDEWADKPYILEKYIQDPKEIDKILAANSVCRIALVATFRKNKKDQEIRPVKATVEGEASGFSDREYFPMPYLFPMGYGFVNRGDHFKDKKIYLHSRKTECKGLKTRLIEQHASVSFETSQIDGLNHPDDPGKPCHFGQSYRSVIGFGTISIVKGPGKNNNEPDERKEALDAIMAQHGVRNLYGKPWDYSEYLDKMDIFKITFLQPLTGKADPPIPPVRLDPDFPFS